MANFAHFTTFPIFSHQSSSFFAKFQNVHLQGVYTGQFSQICNFSNHFQPKQLKMTHNGQFCHQSGLDCVEMTNFGQFSTIHIFSHKKWLRLTQNGQFCLIRNFSNLFPAKRLIFCQISKFSFLGWGGVHQPILPNLQLFKSFPTEMAQNDPQWPILPLKWFGLAQNGQFWSIFYFSHLFPQKAVQIDSEWPILPDLQLFQYFSTKAAHLSQNF